VVAVLIHEGRWTDTSKQTGALCDYANAYKNEFGGLWTVAYPGILFGGGGVQQIELRTEDRENGDLGAVAP
jgi:hypothetical protein